MKRLRRMQKELLFALFDEFRLYERSPLTPRDHDLEVGPLPFEGEPQDLRFLLALEGHPAIRDVRVNFKKGVTYDIKSGIAHPWGTVTFSLSWHGGPGLEVAWEAMRAVWPGEMDEWSRKADEISHD